jgi:D-tyrosyl-tRNA(Tyr) deacylase
MICVIQRVIGSSVEINGKIYSEIKEGITILCAIEKDDKIEDLDWVSKKIIDLRIFSNKEGKFDLSVKDIDGEILLISQFTLCGYARKGRRPDFSNAMEVPKAKEMFEVFVEKLKSYYKPEKIKTGVFGAEMKVNIINDGPVTIILNTNHLKNKQNGRPS